MNRLSQRQKGLIYAILGVLALSPDALLVRLAQVDPWTVMFWRGIFFAASMTAVAWVMDKRFPVPNHKHMQLAVVSAIGNTAFVFALLTTTVANTLVVLSTSPLLGAILSAVFLKERVDKKTWAAAAMVAGSIAAVAWSSYSLGNVWGDVYALISAFCMATTFVMTRARPDLNMVPALGLGGLFGSCIAVPFVTPMATPMVSVAWLMLMGFVVLPVAFTFLAIAPKYATAPDVGLMMLLEAVIGPVWVYWVYEELPQAVVYYAGAAILVTLAIWTFAGIRQYPGALDSANVGDADV